jgi:hypothetical protein
MTIRKGRHFSFMGAWQREPFDPRFGQQPARVHFGLVTAAVKIIIGTTSQITGDTAQCAKP